MTKKSFLILLAVFLLGAFLRFYRLGEVPISFHRDEAFLGYNAYSLLKTGRDMSGSFLPLHLESFIYSPAGYSYFSIPFIWLFSLSSFSVRFASAFFGSLTILVTYFLVKELFLKRSTLEVLAPLATLLLAISPWHINLSRTATENTVVVFFISLGVWLYLKWVKSNRFYFLITSFICFSITLLVYQAPRAFLPLFIPLLLILLPKEKITRKKIISFAALFIAAIVLPLMVVLSSRNLSLRIKTVSIFATSETQLILDQQIREDGVAGTKNLITRVFHNKLVGYSQKVLENYFKHFSYDFLFTDQGLPERYKVPNNGLLYIFELPLLLFGIWSLIKTDKKTAGFLLGFLFLVPVGSALTFDDIPNVQRTLIFFPVLSVISALGAFSLYSILRKRLFGKVIIPLFFLVAVFSFAFYLHQYYIHMSVYRPWHRQDGYRELVEKVNKLLPNYKKAVITNRESAPTVFFLFFSKYDPLLFQEEARKSSLRDFDRISFSKYLFTQEECPVRKEAGGETGILYVNSGLCKLPNNAQVLGTIKRGDNSSAFSLLTVNNEREINSKY